MKAEDFLSQSEAEAFIGDISQTEEGAMLRASPEQLSERQKRAADEKLFETGKKIFPVLGGFTDLFRSGNVPLSVRAGESIKITPEGKAGYLQSLYPDVLAERSPLSGTAEGQRTRGVVGDNRRISIYDPAVGQYQPFNKPGFDTGDIAGLAGPAVSIAPNIAAGLLGPYGQNPLVQGGAGMVGEGLLQAGSAMLPGQESLSPGQRAMRVGIRGATDTALMFGFNKIVQGIDFLRPSNILRRRMVKALPTEEAKEGIRLSGEMKRVGGTGFSPARETLDPEIIKLENTASMSTRGQTLGKVQYNKEISSLQKYLDDTMDRIESSGTPSYASSKGEALGHALERTFKNLTGKLKQSRNATWNHLINKADEVSGGGAVLIPENLFNNVKEVIAREGSPFYSGETARILRNAGLLKKGLKGEEVIDYAVPLTIKQIQNLNKNLGAIKGQQSSQVAKEWKRALMNDIENAKAASPGTPAAQALDLLKEARAKYTMDSANLENVTYSAIAKVAKLDKPLNKVDAIPEAIANKISSDSLSPSELAYLKKVASQEPDIWNKIRRYVIEKPYQESVDSAMKGAPPGMTAKFDPKKYLDNYIGGEKFDILFPKGDPLRQSVLDGLEIARRLGEPIRQTGSAAHAPAQQVSETLGVVGGIFSGHLESAAIFGPRMFGKYATGPFLANAMLDPKNAQLIKTLKITKPGTQQFIRASALLSESLMRQTKEYEVSKKLEEQE